MADYKINNSTIPANAKCECGHTLSAHGSNGVICCACQCRKFVEKESTCETSQATS